MTATSANHKLSEPGVNATLINADGAVKPLSHDHQVVLVEYASRTLYISGQIPVLPDGFEARARQVWANIEAPLAGADMRLDHLVKVTIFLASRDYNLASRKVREKVPGPRDIALTAIICDIFDEAWIVEIEAVAMA